MWSWHRRTAVALVFLALIVVPPLPASAEALLSAAGSTFAYPLYATWFKAYARESSEARFTYQPVGSSEGIRQITTRRVDFGASDGPMTDDQLRQASGPLLHIPVAMGAVVATYNLPGNPELRFTPELLADVFLGKVTKWNDERIKALNSHVDLPGLDVTIVHRSDGSGTTYVLADYLSKVSREWRERLGRGTSVTWPSGVGARGNEGVIRQVRSTIGSVGYAELTYAVANRLPVALIRNRAGKFVEPHLQSTTAAAVGALGAVPDDFRASLTDAAGEAAYPIVSFTWALVYQEQPDEAKGRALVNFLRWAMRDGQLYARDLNYAPLPPPVVARVEATLERLTHRGRPLPITR
jgi:phosphate transport system substrate-binding protein